MDICYWEVFIIVFLLGFALGRLSGRHAERKSLLPYIDRSKLLP